MFVTPLAVAGPASAVGARSTLLTVITVVDVPGPPFPSGTVERHGVGARLR